MGLTVLQAIDLALPQEMVDGVALFKASATLRRGHAVLMQVCMLECLMI